TRGSASQDTWPAGLFSSAREHAERRPAVATSVLVRLLFVSLSLFPAGSPVTGIVVDSSGRPVPRAVVQIVGSDGSTAATVLTESDGTFRVNDAPDGCRVRASLTGFQQAAAACSTNGLRLTLGVAPIAD